MKKCSRCHKEKAFELFRKNSKMLCGFDSWCLACGSALKSLLRKERAQNKKAINISKKKCAKCDDIKDVLVFSKDIGSKDGFDSICKPCRAIKHQERKARVPEIIKAQNRAANHKRDATIPGRIHHRISAQLQYILKERKGGRAWQTLLGYSVFDLIPHLERQFIDGMSWDNMGDWHIDHIVPLKCFNISGVDDPELKAAWALTNLRPLWAKDNMRKSATRTHLI